MLVRTIIGTTVGFLLGTIAHELTHWGADVALGAEVERVRLLPSAHEVAYIAMNARDDVLIRAVTVPLALPVLVGVGLGADGRSLPTVLALLAVGLGYLPRSGSDWSGVLEALTPGVSP